MNLRNVLCILASSILATTVQSASARAPSIELTPISSVAAITPGISAAEIVAHDPSTQRIFVVNALAAKIDVFDISDPAHPQAVVQLDVTPYGAVANSVAVRDGIIAVAVEANPKTDPGRVVFFNSALEFLTSVEVGALPDMLIFSPNGRFVLVANEGEPSLDYTVDPEGSVSVIQITHGNNGAFSATARTADFKAFNNATLDPSIRIFGPDKSKPPGAIASVAQDLEPEFIAVSQDSKTAWVTCQENNAIRHRRYPVRQGHEADRSRLQGPQRWGPDDDPCFQSRLAAVDRHNTWRPADQARWLLRPTI